MSTDQAGAAVLSLFDAYFDRVYRFARRSVDAAAAEELAQDVFIKLLSRPDIERKQVSVSYLIKIADNMLKRRHRTAERNRRLVSELARNAPGREGSGDTDRDGVLTAFDRLGPEEQEAVRLIVCEGLSYADAAASMGVKVSTVNNWKHRGIKRLKEDAQRRREEDARHACTQRRGEDGRSRGGQSPGSDSARAGDRCP